MANTLCNQRDWKALLKHLFVNYNYVFSFVLCS
jgi:hypothetical protein